MRKFPPPPTALSPSGRYFSRTRAALSAFFFSLSRLSPSIKLNTYQDLYPCFPFFRGGRLFVNYDRFFEYREWKFEGFR